MVGEPQPDSSGVASAALNAAAGMFRGGLQPEQCNQREESLRPPRRSAVGRTRMIAPSKWKGSVCRLTGECAEPKSRGIDIHIGNLSRASFHRNCPPMQELNLPSDLVIFLRGRRELVYPAADCEVGAVVLEWLEDLELSKAEVHVDDEEMFADDPHFGEAGHYVIPCVSLLLDCAGYLPWGILCWFPTERQFGTVDSDHGKVVLFGPEIGWSEIVHEPARWLSLQWSETAPECIRPRGGYPFVPVTQDREGLDQALEATRARLAALEAKCRRRGIVDETNHAGFIRGEIEALESLLLQKAASVRPAGGIQAATAPEYRDEHESAAEAVPEGFAALLRQQLLVLEEMVAKAPVAQQEQVRAQMDAIRKQVGRSGDK